MSEQKNYIIKSKNFANEQNKLNMLFSLLKRSKKIKSPQKLIMDIELYYASIKEEQKYKFMELFELYLYELFSYGEGSAIYINCIEQIFNKMSKLFNYKANLINEELFSL